MMPEPALFRKLPKFPPEAELKPLELDKPDKLFKVCGDENAIEKAIVDIRNERDRRIQIDPAVRTDPKRQSEMANVDWDNAASLLGRVKDYGWIDVAVGVVIGGIVDLDILLFRGGV